MNNKLIQYLELISVICAFAALLFLGQSVVYAATTGTETGGVVPVVLAAAKKSVPKKPLEISGWVPYWSALKGTRDARKHLDVMTAVYPFAFTLKSNGTLKDNANLSKSSWQRLFRDAKEEGVLVIPTIMTEGGKALHAILSDPARRAAHIEEVVEMIEEGEYDGVDIDYEAKLVATRDYFSAFLKELEAALPKDKMITCAIESRTPADSLYANVPANLQYSNDLVAIGTYCDRVEIMGYDQRNADIKLNAEKNGTEPYLPVSDADWVRKVIVEMSTFIPKEKLVLGVATYGHEYTVTVNSKGTFIGYDRVRAINPDTALELAEKHDAETSRTNAGEIAFTYKTKSGKLAAASSIPDDTPEGLIVAARAREYAMHNGKTTTFNYVTWSDAKAIEEKVQLAKETGIAGVAIFKFDGQEDPELWDIFGDGEDDND
jgi:spore germination protein YaaH